GESFGDLLANFVQGVDGLGAEAEAAKDAFLNGDPVDLHEVMILAEESGIAFDLLLELRNKLIEAYQELIRMPL
ncbi:MAG TPA: flagellar hook-basal body complex protein FliE, partial [candidate division Zixibacteria bacterium]|nr:flagellar hook-basal body complex protein FliE [candidate division Zixibacteria bacterium]